MRQIFGPLQALGLAQVHLHELMAFPAVALGVIAMQGEGADGIVPVSARAYALQAIQTKIHRLLLTGQGQCRYG